MDVDGGLLLVSVLHKAERLKVKAGVLANAVGGDGRLLVHPAAGGDREDGDGPHALTRCLRCCGQHVAVVHQLTSQRSCVSPSGSGYKGWMLQSTNPETHRSCRQQHGGGCWGQR